MLGVKIGHMVTHDGLVDIWWHMEALSASLALCDGIHRSPIHFPHKGTGMRSFDALFDTNSRDHKDRRRKDQLEYIVRYNQGGDSWLL